MGCIWAISNTKIYKRGVKQRYIYKYLYSRCWDFRAQCRCVSTAANGSEHDASLCRGSPSHPHPHGGPNRNEFVFGGDPHGDSPPPPPGPVRPAASGGGVGFLPSRAASTNVPTAFVLRGRHRSGAPAPTHRRRPPAS